MNNAVFIATAEVSFAVHNQQIWKFAQNIKTFWITSSTSRSRGIWSI